MNCAGAPAQSSPEGITLLGVSTDPAALALLDEIASRLEDEQ